MNQDGQEGNGPWRGIQENWTFLFQLAVSGPLAPNIYKVTNIPLYKHTSICLSIDLLLNVNIVSSVGLLWIQVLWTFFVQVFIGTYVFISPG